ncbi:hypothetical protein IAD21_03349 [Abditibacteriota bacterium]|nr:hypothetical protein IAD21_03349 [Abditibacteriota bacterium]
MLVTKYPSPTGKYLFQISPWEARMSLWIESPALLKADTNQTIFTFKNSNWSLDSADWLDTERVKMSLRRYPGDHNPSSFEVELNCLTFQATIDGQTFDFAALEKHLEVLYRQGQTKVGHSTPVLGRLASLLSRFRS